MKNSSLRIGKKLPHAPPASTVASMSVPIHSADTPELGMREFVFHSPAMRDLYTVATQVAGLIADFARE